MRRLELNAHNGGKWRGGKRLPLCYHKLIPVSICAHRDFTARWLDFCKSYVKPIFILILSVNWKLTEHWKTYQYTLSSPVMVASMSTETKNLLATSNNASFGQSMNQSIVMKLINAGYCRKRTLRKANALRKPE